MHNIDTSHLLHNLSIFTLEAYLCLFLDVFQEWKHCVRSRVCKNAVREPLHGRTMEVAQPHWTHVGLHERCTQLYHRGWVLNEVTTTHLKSKWRLRGSRHVISGKGILIMWINCSLFWKCMIIEFATFINVTHTDIKNSNGGKEKKKGRKKERKDRQITPLPKCLLQKNTST